MLSLPRDVLAEAAASLTRRGTWGRTPARVDSRRGATAPVSRDCALLPWRCRGAPRCIQEHFAGEDHAMTSSDFSIDASREAIGSGHQATLEVGPP